MSKKVLIGALVFSILASILLVAGCAGQAPAATTTVTAPPVTVTAGAGATATVTTTATITATPASTAAPTPAAAKYKWRMPTHLIPASLDWTVLQEWTQGLKDASGGQIEITLYKGGELMPTAEMTPSVGKGVVEIATASPSYNSGAAPIGELAYGAPGIPDRLEDLLNLWYRNGWIEIAREAWAKAFNVYFLGPVPGSQYGAIMSKKPVKSLADVKGLKLIGAGATGEAYKKLGAAMVTIPWAEVYSAASTGLVDATILGGPAVFRDSKIHEPFKYYIGPSIMSFQSSYIGINLDIWKSLPDSLKTIFERSMGQYQLTKAGLYYHNDIGARADLVKAGVTFSSFSDEDIAALKSTAMEVLDERAQKDPYNAKFVAALRDYTK